VDFLGLRENVFFLIEYRGGGLTPTGRVFLVEENPVDHVMNTTCYIDNSPTGAMYRSYITQY
jgi:hypothetical protein